MEVDTNVNCTASGKYQFNTIYFNKTITEWIIIINHEVAIQNNFKKINIYPGKFGFDSLIYSLSLVLSHLTKNTSDIYVYMSGELDVTKYLELIHKGWSKNYMYWINNEPYDLGLYKKPSKPLISDERNINAMMYYNKLPEYIQNVYKDILASLFKTLANEIINEGIKNLKI